MDNAPSEAVRGGLAMASLLASSAWVAWSYRYPLVAAALRVHRALLDRRQTAVGRARSLSKMFADDSTLASALLLLLLLLPLLNIILMGDSLLRVADRAFLAVVRRWLRAPHALLRPTDVLELACLLTPRRINEEDIGEAIEVINELVAARAPRWKVWTKVASSAFWVGVASLRYFMQAVRGGA